MKKNSNASAGSFAWIGIVVLVGLYVTTLILAFSGSPMAQALFRGSFAATVVFPVLLYAMQIIYRILKPDDTADDPDKKKKMKSLSGPSSFLILEE